MTIVKAIKQVFLMNAMTGTAVCPFVLMLSLSMITKPKERNLNNGKIETCKSK